MIFIYVCILVKKFRVGSNNVNAGRTSRQLGQRSTSRHAGQVQRGFTSSSQTFILEFSFAAYRDFEDATWTTTSLYASLHLTSTHSIERVRVKAIQARCVEKPRITIYLRGIISARIFSLSVFIFTSRVCTLLIILNSENVILTFTL